MSPPSDVTIEFLQNPTEDFVNEAVTLTSALMAKDPAAISLTGGNMDLIDELNGAMIRPLALCPGVAHNWAARDASGVLVGYTQFCPPGQHLNDTEEQRQVGGLYKFLEKLSPEGQKYYSETMTQTFPKIADDILGVKEVERSWYWCIMAMVRADYQGKGIAKEMFELAYKEAAKFRKPVGLSTTNSINIPKYEGMGLIFRGEREMPSPWGDWKVWILASREREEFLNHMVISE